MKPVYNQNPYRVVGEALKELAEDMRHVADYIDNSMLIGGLTLDVPDIRIIRQRWALIKNYLKIDNGGKDF